MNLPEQLVEKILEFGKTLKSALNSPDNKEIVPQIEESLHVVMDSLNNEELGLFGMTVILMLGKLAETKAVDAKDNIRTSVVSARAMIQEIDKANAKFNMSYFEIAMMIAYDFEFKPSPDTLTDELLKRRFEEIDCVGEC
jgi:hypothetical protein